MAEILQGIHQAKDLWVLELPAVLPLQGRPSQKVQLGLESAPLGCPDIPARVNVHTHMYITYAYAYIYIYMVSY